MMAGTLIHTGNDVEVSTQGGYVVENWEGNVDAYYDVASSSARDARNSQLLALKYIPPYKIGDPHPTIMAIPSNGTTATAGHICSTEGGQFSYSFTYLTKKNTRMIGATSSTQAKALTTCTFSIVPPPKIEVAHGMSARARNTTMGGDAVIVKYKGDNAQEITRLVDYNGFVPSATIVCAVYFSARCSDGYGTLARKIINATSNAPQVFYQFQGSTPSTIMLASTLTEQIDMFLYRRVVTLIVNNDGWNEVGVHRSTSGQVLATPDNITAVKKAALSYAGGQSGTILRKDGAVAFAPYAMCGTASFLQNFDIAEQYLKLIKEY